MLIKIKNLLRNIAEKLDINMTPESLSVHYSELLVNYQTIKEMHQSGTHLDVYCQYFQEFDDIYSEYFDGCQDYEVVEEIIPRKVDSKEEVIKIEPLNMRQKWFVSIRKIGATV